MFGNTKRAHDLSTLILAGAVGFRATRAVSKDDPAALARAAASWRDDDSRSLTLALALEMDALDCAQWLADRGVALAGESLAHLCHHISLRTGAFPHGMPPNPALPQPDGMDGGDGCFDAVPAHILRIAHFVADNGAADAKGAVTLARHCLTLDNFHAALAALDALCPLFRGLDRDHACRFLFCGLVDESRTAHAIRAAGSSLEFLRGAFGKLSARGVAFLPAEGADGLYGPVESAAVFSIVDGLGDYTGGGADWGAYADLFRSLEGLDPARASFGGESLMDRILGPGSLCDSPLVEELLPAAVRVLPEGARLGHYADRALAKGGAALATLVSLRPDRTLYASPDGVPLAARCTDPDDLAAVLACKGKDGPVFSADEVDALGRTPLLRALLCPCYCADWSRRVRLLVEGGAALDAKTPRGLSVRTLAAEREAEVRFGEAHLRASMGDADFEAMLDTLKNIAYLR